MVFALPFTHADTLHADLPILERGQRAARLEVHHLRLDRGEELPSEADAGTPDRVDVGNQDLR